MTDATRPVLQMGKAEELILPILMAMDVLTNSILCPSQEADSRSTKEDTPPLSEILKSQVCLGLSPTVMTELTLNTTQPDRK